MKNSGVISKNSKNTYSNNDQTLFAVDASIYIFQSYFGFPETFFSKSGRSINAVYGYTHWLLKFLLDVRPKYISACFDESLITGFRHTIDPAYKSNRVLPDEALSYQLLACKKITELLGIPCYASETYEADDFIASSVRIAERLDLDSCVVSRDKDLAQLLCLDVDVTSKPVVKRDLKEGFQQKIQSRADVSARETPEEDIENRSVSDITRTFNTTMWHYPSEAKINALDFYRKHQVKPELMADFLAIVGDSADAIEGVPGVGAKTVIQLFKHFPGWRLLKDNLDSITDLPIRGAKRLQGLMQSHTELIDKNIRLTTLIDNIFIQNAIDDVSMDVRLTKQRSDTDALFLLFDEFNFPKKMYSDVETEQESN